MNSSRRILINADCAEGTPGSDHDRDLVTCVDAVNLACGGHAGDPAWTRELAQHASACGVDVHLHPGYPDREHFGRRHLDMPWDRLRASLDAQRAVLPEVQAVKFHGALYNRSMGDDQLAARLADWCRATGITTVLAMPASALADAAAALGLQVLREGFADRAYEREGGGLRLCARGTAGAVLTDLPVAMAQVRAIVESGEVPLRDGTRMPLQCDTLCIHGDADHGLALARALRLWQESCI